MWINSLKLILHSKASKRQTEGGIERHFADPVHSVRVTNAITRLKSSHDYKEGGGGNDNEVNSTDWSNSGHQSVDNSWIICRATKPPCKFAFTYKRMSQRRDRRACPSYSTVFVSSNQHDLPTNASNPSVLSPRCIAHEGIFF